MDFCFGVTLLRAEKTHADFLNISERKLITADKYQVLDICILT